MELSKIEKLMDKQKVNPICSMDEEKYPNEKTMLKQWIKEFHFSTNPSE